MLPPLLEMYVVWHPGDSAGERIARALQRHFSGSSFTGLIGGAVELYIRSEGLTGPGSAPRPIPTPHCPPPNGLPQAQYTAVIPLLGMEFAAAVEDSSGPWWSYARDIAEARDRAADRVGVFPFLLAAEAVDGTELGRIFGRWQRLAAPMGGEFTEPETDALCRDLAQGVSRLVAGDPRHQLTVFISHTNRSSLRIRPDVMDLVTQVRSVISRTRLAHFIDSSDLQPGTEWEPELLRMASSSALLAVRTDDYASREWCQKEMLVAKRAGMPVVVLDALQVSEQRGSFLMDHVPRVAVRRSLDGWSEPEIRLALNMLVSEHLKRLLWNRQRSCAESRPDLDVAWWAPHAPEPTTLAAWLAREYASRGRLHGSGRLRILHPDPPLGPDEAAVLNEMAVLWQVEEGLDIMTPRLLAARGG